MENLSFFLVVDSRSFVRATDRPVYEVVTSPSVATTHDREEYHYIQDAANRESCLIESFESDIWNEAAFVWVA